MPTYKGKFTTIKNPLKYVGDISKITYRSLWERNVMRWCDESHDVLEWASEEIAIPYINPLTGKRARYYPDFYIKMKDGTLKVVEVKPKKQTRPPIPPTRKSKKFIEEQAVFALNAEKWQNAYASCVKNGMEFEVWTEDTLKAMGILSFEADKTLLAAERKAMPTSKYNKSRRKPNPKVGPPKRRS